VLREAELRLEGGLGFTAGLDPNAARLVAGLDPTRSVREVLEDAADAVEAERSEFVPAGLQLLRRMLTLGFVVPAEERGGGSRRPLGRS
jgi:hypothetical protein